MLSVLALDARIRTISLIVGSCFFLVLLDSVIIATSLPVMAESFSVDAIHLSIAISCYLLSVAVFMPVSGWLADCYGARRIFLISILIFILASILCGLARSLPEFIVARILQGVGGALLLPLGRVVILHVAPKTSLAKAMAILTWPALTAPVLGPILGGVITTYFNWRWNFFINFPIGLVVFTLAYRAIPNIVSEGKRPFDATGFILTATALVCVLVSMEAFAHGWLNNWSCAGLVAVGMAAAVFAVAHLRRVPSPLIRLAPLSIPSFFMSCCHLGVPIRIGINAVTFLLPILVQVCFGYTALEAGFFLFVYFLGNLFAKTFTTVLLSQFGFKRLLLMNGFICGVFVGLVGLLAQEVSIVWIMLILFLAGMTRSVQYAALNTLTYAEIPPSLRSAATTIASMSMQVSLMLSVACSVAILQVISAYSGRATLIATDFMMAFVVMALMVFLPSLGFCRLSRSTGEDVSGHSSK